MRILCQKNRTFKPDNNTRNYQNEQKKLSTGFDWSIPENLKSIPKKIANFYKRFIRDFSKMAAFFNALVEKTFFFSLGF